MLHKLVKKTGASGGIISYDHSGGPKVIHIGEGKATLSLPKNEQRILLMGKPLSKPDAYIHPINCKDCVCGLISLHHNAENRNPLSEDLVQAYAQLAAQNIDMQKSQHSLTQYANSLLEKKNELEKIQQYNQNLLSITTHDLSSPLNAVSGYLDLINDTLNEGRNTEKIKHYHQRIQSGVNDVSEMLGQLDEVIKYEKGFLTLDTVEINVNWLVEEVCDVLTANAQAKGVDLQVSTPDDPVYVEMDVVKFKRVIYNLVSNAIKYTSTTRHVHVALTCCDDEVKLCVRDEGIGISEDKLEAIFEPFVKLNDDRENKFSKGLGLYISSYFVDLMGGTIKVQSTAGKGSIFTVMMPWVASAVSEYNSA